MKSWCKRNGDGEVKKEGGREREVAERRKDG
jgi:hypothetical protein